MGGERVTVGLCGDVMLGRGVDQVLPHPGAPQLRESCIRDAREYVRLAEAVSGAIPQPVPYAWPWGDALGVLEEEAPDALVVNLETSITAGDDFAPGKGVHYRMHPDNLQALAVARPDVCVLANNHSLDFGRRGLGETLESVSAAGARAAGAGRDLGQAQAPAAVSGGDAGRVVVFAYGMRSSGVPEEWAAGEGRSGVAFAPEPSPAEAARIGKRIRAVKQPGDVVVVSLHWGSNWGYGVSRQQVWFAHALSEAGADVVYGHSSHHPRPVEVHRGRLILYGCGDFIDDYEGIAGYEAYRDDLRLLYLVSVEAGTGRFDRLRMVPLQARRMRLRYASRDDAEWLGGTLQRVSRDFGTRVAVGEDGVLTAGAARE